jgi:hypothetical protein
MRQSFRWVVRIVIAIVALAVASEVALLGVNAVEKHRLSAFLQPSARWWLPVNSCGVLGLLIY